MRGFVPWGTRGCLALDMEPAVCTETSECMTAMRIQPIVTLGGSDALVPLIDH